MSESFVGWSSQINCEFFTKNLDCYFYWLVYYTDNYLIGHVDILTTSFPLDNKSQHNE